MTVTVAFASDHAGYALKQELIAFLSELKGDFSALDLGTHDSVTSVDYPDYGDAAARSIQEKKADFAVVVCGSGVGISIAANRHAGVRAALCHHGLIAKLARQHNDANVLALGARMIGVEVAKDCLLAFLTTPFEGGRHEKRMKNLG
jgi:ribose 5-phosphate isomerase B